MIKATALPLCYSLMFGAPLILSKNGNEFVVPRHMKRLGVAGTDTRLPSEIV